MNSDIAVSVVCLTYNHRKYIEDALDSIIAQKTAFPFEIIIHDDASTDGTAELIRKYEKEYPELVRPIYEETNQWSKGNEVFLDLSLPYVKGKYIAFCEGDDYWIDEQKLQLQYDIMEAHPELDMCACRASVVLANNGIEIDEIGPKQEDCILSAEEVIAGGGGYLATASLFARKCLFNSLMECEKILAVDYTHQIKGSLRGGIYYLNRKMAAYRQWVENSWTTKFKNDTDRRNAHAQEEIAMLQELDKETNGIYHAIIKKRTSGMAFSYFDELMIRSEEIKAELATLSGTSLKLYLWGLGMRGDAFQKFCRQEKIELDGVCDLRDINIGENTEYGYQIISTTHAFHNSDVLLTSNDSIYNDLVKGGYSGYLINLQKYML